MPAINPVLSSVVIPPPQLNVYVPVPPVGVIFIAPVLAPKHTTFVLVFVDETAVGCVIVLVNVLVQTLASVTKTVYVPAVKPVFVGIVRPLDQT